MEETFFYNSEIFLSQLSVELPIIFRVTIIPQYNNFDRHK